MEEVVVAVGREPQLREEGDRRPLGRGAPRQRDRPLDVEGRIGDPQVRRTDGHAQKVVGIDRVEGWSCHIVCRVPLPRPFRNSATWPDSSPAPAPRPDCGKFPT